MAEHITIDGERYPVPIPTSDRPTLNTHHEFFNDLYYGIPANLFVLGRVGWEEWKRHCESPRNAGRKE